MARSKSVGVALAGAVGGLLLVLSIGVVLFRPSEAPPVDPAEGQDVIAQIVEAYGGVENGSLPLDPPSKASTDALASDAVPEKAVPNFGPKHVAIRGATRLTIAGTGASVIAYNGDEVGHFEVISVKVKREQVPGLSIVPFGQRRFLNGIQHTDGGDLHLVGVQQGSRLTFLVGHAPAPKLSELASMIQQ